MSRFIIGLRAGHNASACIGDESGLLYAIQEERICREKNYWGYPRLAIKACLDHVRAGKNDLAGFAYGASLVLCDYHSRDDVIAAYRRQASTMGRWRQRVVMPLIVAARPNYGQPRLRKLLNEDGYEGVPVTHYDHHLSHAASAYFGLRSSSEQRYLVLTCDGAGDNLCATVGIWSRGQVQPVAETNMANSLGAIYSWITYAMGFVPLEHEYKLMGMAPYASEKAAEETARIFHSYLTLGPDGLSFRHTRRNTNNLHDIMERDLRGMRFDYICAGLQRFTEDLLCNWARGAVRATGVRDVLAAGGVFMNVKANKRIAEIDEIDSFEAFPSCGDETLPFGSFYMHAAKQFGDAAVKPLSHFYLGDDLDQKETEAALRSSGFAFDRPADMAEAIADLLVAGHPVARCTGPMEFGARALGNRSILADPRSQDVVRVINRMVKKRDFWMPFAPIVKQERQHDYLQNPKQLRSPYMMMTFDTRENFRDLIAAVHNADLTCRAQILAREQNPQVYDVLTAFERKTGCGVLLNTSFNLHGFPIVRNAADALEVLADSGLEYLQVGDYLVSKNSQGRNGAVYREAQA